MTPPPKVPPTWDLGFASWPPKPAANLAYSCEVGQPLAGTPTCDRSLGFKARAADLGARLNLSDHVDLFFSYPGTPYLPSLNVKGWSLLV